MLLAGHLEISWEVFEKKSADILSFRNSFITISIPDDTMMTRMMFAARKKGLMLLFFMVWIASVSANGIPPQVFIREPPDKTAVIGGQLPV